LLPPEIEKAKEAVKHITTDLGDVLTYALYPTTGMRFLRWKHGLEEPPAEVKPKTLEQAKREQELVAKAKKGLLVEPPAKAAPARSGAARKFNVFVDGEYFEIEVDPADGVAAPAVRPAPVREVMASAPAAQTPPRAAAAPAPANAAPAVSANGAGAVTAPMPGIIVEYRVTAGQAVKAGDVVLVLEAMKMQNEIAAEVAGKVATLTHKAGDEVLKGDVLLVIEP
jgi:pyruvate carboxylase subunit B